MRIVATTSLPAFDRPNDDRWNAARSCQKLGDFLENFREDNEVEPKFLHAMKNRISKGWNIFTLTSKTLENTTLI